MDIDQLRKMLEQANVLLVQVEGSTSVNKTLDFTASGALEEYIGALKVLHAPIVYVFTESLEEEDFIYQGLESESVDDEDEGAESSALDLCSVDSELEKFRSRIGQIGEFRLCAPIPSHQLNFFIQETWYEDFLTRLDDATQRVDEEHNALRSDADAQEELKVKTLVASLHKLIDDSAFVRLRTQKAMLAYAHEHINGIEEFDQSIVKEEIQNIRAKLMARGLAR